MKKEFVEHLDSASVLSIVVANTSLWGYDDKI